MQSKEEAWTKYCDILIVRHSFNFHLSQVTILYCSTSDSTLLEFESSDSLKGLDLVSNAQVSNFLKAQAVKNSNEFEEIL